VWVVPLLLVGAMLAYLAAKEIQAALWPHSGFLGHLAIYGLILTAGVVALYAVARRRARRGP